MTTNYVAETIGDFLDVETTHRHRHFRATIDMSYGYLIPEARSKLGKGHVCADPARKDDPHSRASEIIG